MYFDSKQNAYIDKETGAVIFREEDEDNVEIPTLTPELSTTFRAQSIRNVPSQTIALRTPVSPTIASSGSRDFTSGYRSISPPDQSRSVDMEQELFDLYRQGSLEIEDENPQIITSEEAREDWNLARSLQMFEFELMDDQTGDAINDDPAAVGDFHQKEYRASRSCRRQLLTASFFICMLQIGVLIAMITMDGFASANENPSIGPPVYSMVRFGAKESALIVRRKEWWRIISPTMLHAGIIHIVPNVAIQLRVGGYLNLVYGTVKWLWIYFFSGIFGVMMSCCFLPDTVGVGSSGALMGMLASWAVWILFRWNKIPKEHHKIRNCQLAVVLASIGITMATSAMPNVDWAAHAGGAFQGALWGIILLSNELHSKYCQVVMKLIALLISLVAYALAIYYMIYELKPSTDNLDYWDTNDDWK